MYGIALARAIPPRTASAVLFFGVWILGLWSGGPLQAQEAIYRCGQEYTNAPKDLSLCERLPQQSVTRISGLRPQATEPNAMPKAAAPQPSHRTVLAQALARLEKQHQAWAQELEMLMSQTGTAEYGAAPKNQDRVAALHLAMERAEREMETLQREAARGPQAALPGPMPVAKP